MSPLVDIAVASPSWYALYQRYAFAAGPYSPYIGAALPDLLARLEGEGQRPPDDPSEGAATPSVTPLGLRERLPEWDPSPSRLLIVDIPAEEGLLGASALLAQHTFPVFAWPGPFGDDATRIALARRLVPVLAAAACVPCQGYALLVDRGRLSAGRPLSEDDLPTEEWLRQAKVDTVAVWTRDMADDLDAYLRYLARYGFSVIRRVIPTKEEGRG
ncbi:MAG TPA: hypothetical protein VIK75_10465 [Calditerricola sp.]